MKNTTYLHISFLLIATFAQLSCTNSATRAYNKGLKYQQKGYNNEAIVYYKKSLEKGGSKARLNFLIGENYRLTNRMREALPYYAEAIKAKSKEDRLKFYYAQALEASGKYEDARIAYLKYAKSGLNSSLKKMAAEEAAFLKEIHTLLNRDTYYYIRNVGNYLNTDGPEYAPVIKDGEVIYTGENSSRVYKATGQGFTDIMAFKPDSSLEKKGTKREFDSRINNALTHEACATFSPDGMYMVFVRSNTGKRKGSVDTDLYFSEMRDGEWSRPEMLNISEPRAWESTPYISPDGKTLYFASNRKGGFGGIDLYKSTLSDSGWTKPKNLGSKINTPGNEMFPYVRKDGKFFFASDGHPGLGSLDIFAAVEDSTVVDSTLSENGILNLGPPINSNADDFGIFYKDNLMGGYFASNRDGGMGDDDIYEFWIGPKVQKPVRNLVTTYLTVAVVAEPEDKYTKPTPIDSASVALDFDTGDDFKDSVTNAKGIVTFEIDTNATYVIRAEKRGYFASALVFDTRKEKFEQERTSITEDVFVRNYYAKVELQKVEIGKEIVLKNILYDYNKYNIREDAEPDLKLLIAFMKQNPNIVVELGSHTDSRGNDAYNLRLSQLRAQAAVDYIVANGIERGRIKAVGYGESKHIIENAQTEEEHQVNRRTEFKIVGVRE